MFDPFEKDIAAMSEAMAQGKTSAVALVEFYLERILRYDQQGPCLNAVVTLNPHVLDAAERLDDERKNGMLRSPLHGIPLLLKDNLDTFDLPTTAGSQALKNNRPATDAFVVHRLRKAGAVILGKTNLSEFARHGITVGSLMGQTLNPYDLTRTPGGSSGGTGAAVAANMAAAGLGTDTVNSVRSPSSANSLVGLRPTTGLLSRSGIVPNSFTQDTAGPMARSVQDCQILLETCMGYDPRDEKTREQLGRSVLMSPLSYRENGLQDRKIGLITTLLGEDPDVKAAVRQSLHILEDLGGEIIPLDVPEFESARVIRECDVQLYETKKILNEYFSGIPHCPVKHLDELVAGGLLHESILPKMKASAALEDPLQHPVYRQKLQAIDDVKRLALQLMAAHQMDVFFYPHQQILVEPVAQQDQRGRNGILASVMGFPAITVPGGFASPTQDAVRGVPIGVEFMARPFEESLLLEIAFLFEQKSQFRQPPLLTP